MNLQFKDGFLFKWRKYFGGSELPIAYEYTEDEQGIPPVDPKVDHRCVIADLEKARAGHPVRFKSNTFGCTGGKSFCGYAPRPRANIAEFLSHDAKGEGERYKKNPEIAERAIASSPPFPAPAANLIFKRWDRLTEADHPTVVIFFATPDVLSGLFTLAGYDVADNESAVIAPFGAGCASIVKYANHEGSKENPRAILGMFDVSARPYVPANVLSFAVPMKRFEVMVGNMDESFLITESWQKVETRIESRQR
jgi:uncharacterized protein (DUF169 family)